MNQDDMRALMALVGCCCDCECPEDAAPDTPRRGASPLSSGQQPDGAGRNPRTGQPEMPPLKPRPVIDEGFIPGVASYDSPQRPSSYGRAHLPGNDLLDFPLYEQQPDVSPVNIFFVSDDGVLHDLGVDSFRGFPMQCAVDHENRVLITPPSLSVQTVKPYQSGNERFIYSKNFYEYAMPGLKDEYVQTETSSGAGPGLTYSVQREESRQVQYSNGASAPTILTPFSVNQPGRKIKIRYVKDDEDIEITQFRYVVEGAQRPGETGTLASLFVQSLQAFSPGWDRWRLVGGVQPSPDAQSDEAAVRFPWNFGAWVDLQLGEERISQTFSGFAYGGPTPFDIEATVPLDFQSVRWTSPDGRITIAGPPTTAHHRLSEGDTLTWPGGNITINTAEGGSWAGYRNYAGTVLLIQFVQDGESKIMRVDIPSEGIGTAQLMDAAQFELSVLGAPLIEFDRAGPLMNTWPPQHALARITPVGESSIS